MQTLLQVFEECSFCFLHRLYSLKFPPQVCKVCFSPLAHPSLASFNPKSYFLLWICWLFPPGKSKGVGLQMELCMNGLVCSGHRTPGDPHCPDIPYCFTPMAQHLFIPNVTSGDSQSPSLFHGWWWLWSPVKHVTHRANYLLMENLSLHLFFIFYSLLFKKNFTHAYYVFWLIPHLFQCIHYSPVTLCVLYFCVFHHWAH